ncbi:MAG TPA: hypothetical protein VE650_00835, partial [Acetobacteraceae bacterium]|nr:hypothetical protein [Acetobacteraceae bacterium]
MAKAAPEQVGMEKAELKTHVKLARRAPVHIAFALGGDGKAVIMMDKRKQPRAILKELKEQASDARNHRFGQMAFDPENPKLARITVDKAASGMARKLVVAFKGTGVKQIELMTEDGQSFDSAVNEEDEAEDDEEERRPNPAAQAGQEIAGGIKDLGAGDIAGGIKGVAEGIGDAIGGLFGGEQEHQGRRTRGHEDNESHSRRGEDTKSPDQRQAQEQDSDDEQ